MQSSDYYYDLLVQGRMPRRLSAGEIVFNQGERGDGMYVVRGGSVELRSGDRLIETISAPGLFGEMALIEDAPRSLTAVAAADTELVWIPAQQFWVMVHSTPYFAQLVMSEMARRLRQQSIAAPAV